MGHGSDNSDSNNIDALLVNSLMNSYFLYSCSKNGEVTYVSSSVTNVLGYGKEEFLKTINKSGHYFSMCDRCGVPSQDSLNGDKTEPYEIQIPHKDGSPCWLEVSEFPMCVEDGEVSGVKCILHNISDRKRAELGLQTSVEKLRKALACACDCFAGAAARRGVATDLRSAY